ncbi:unnamed protein product [Durusdinium trenchii]|uniref:SET domain-containing protein n=1 Tax=Durusdinium trenchii TaxID=1381693 RepID=A0ABP0PSY6_9DINO
MPPAVLLLLLGALLVLGAAVVRRLCGGSAEKFLLVETAERGKALVAKGSFKQGDVILLEEAILSLAAGASPVAALGLLSRSQRRRLAALHCHTRLAPARAEDGAGALSEQLGEEGERLLEEMVASGVWTAEQAVQDAGWLWQLLRVWDANKLSFVTAQGPEQCVFERISRLNHSCEPNVRLLPAGPKQLLVVAAVDIREGEELCICYPERNILPMLHFLHAPTSWRRRTLERWQFLCRCVRCEAPRPEQVEDLEEEARALVSPLQAATSSEDFPIDQVLQLLSQCQDAGLGCDHWLSFWLLSLCMVGSSARPLQVASHGVARASHLPRGGDHVGKVKQHRMDSLVYDRENGTRHRPLHSSRSK